MCAKWDVLCAGLAVMDVVVSPVDDGLFTRDTTYVKGVTTLCGGDAFNAAIGIAALGGKSALSCLLGNDNAAKTLFARAQEGNVDTSAVQFTDAAGTSACCVLCMHDGERHFAFDPGANALYQAQGLTDEILSRAKVLFIGGMMGLDALNGEPLKQLFMRAQKLGVKTAMDVTAPKDGVWLEKIQPALAYTDIFLPSIQEAKYIVGETEPAAIEQKLHDLGVKIAGVKMGAKGVLVNGIHTPPVPIAPEEIVDTCGAGDAFMAGFLLGIAREMDLSRCARLGSASASACIRSSGSTSNPCSWETAMAYMQLIK